MKNINSLIFSFLFLSISYAQNTLELDKKAGFKNIKIGNPITSLGENVSETANSEGVYFVRDLSEYYIEEHLIDQILIKVTKDDQKLIQEFSLVFFDPYDKLMKIANDKSRSYDSRIAAAEKAKNLTATSSEFFFYRSLFESAFGTFTATKNTETWKGKKIVLAANYNDGDGVCIFSSIKDLTTSKSVKPEEAKKAINKF